MPKSTARLIALPQRIQESRGSVPEGIFQAHAELKVRIPRSEILRVWEETIRACLPLEEHIPPDDLEKRLVGCQEAIACALQELGGPREYYTLLGYTDFQKRLFRSDYWKTFQTRFVDIAPYLENLSRIVNSRLRLDFRPEVIARVEGYLREAGYPKWSPDFFKRHAEAQGRGISAWIRDHIRGYDGLPNWQLILERLSPEARARFERRPAPRRIDRTQLISLLTTTLDLMLKKHEYWTPYGLGETWSGLYEALRQEFRTPALRPDRGDVSEQASRPNWPAILLELSDAHRSRFRWAFGKEMVYRREEDAVQEFIEILTQWQPPQWGPKWLDENGFWALRMYWENHFRTEKGHIDWPRLLRQLPQNLQEGFDPPDRSS